MASGRTRSTIRWKTVCSGGRDGPPCRPTSGKPGWNRTGRATSSPGRSSLPKPRPPVPTMPWPNWPRTARGWKGLTTPPWPKVSPPCRKQPDHPPVPYALQPNGTGLQPGDNATMTDSSPPGQVAFSYQDWLAAYPAFVGHVSAGQAESFFQLAELILNNTGRSPVRDMTRRRTLLWLLIAHQAQLFATETPAQSGEATGSPPAAPPVGRVASATRGAVSITLDGSTLPRQAGWFSQTQYGLIFWQATAPLRQMRFLPGQAHPAYLWP
ncbi:DUF4054 domain-containing protein [Bombella sp. ESL0387]|nr:DUF4054 domain-containing protein [Bombella sp. ESL0387]